MRHSELKDGGGGTLAVRVVEELLGVVIQFVALEAGNMWVARGGCCTHAHAHTQTNTKAHGHGEAWRVFSGEHGAWAWADSMARAQYAKAK